MSNTWWQWRDEQPARRIAAPVELPATSQMGYVRQWRARGYDVRLMFGTSPELETPAQENEEIESGEAQSAALDDGLRWRLAAMLQPEPELLLRQSGPMSWPHTLFDFQGVGVRVLLKARHLLLGDDMGLGKTAQTLAALRVLLHRRQIERALIVAPASLLEQWRRAAAEWAPELRVMVVGGAASMRSWQWRYRAHLTVVSYETLRADWEGLLSEDIDFAKLPTRGGWDVVILDEAQKIKNRDSAVAQVCKALPRRRSWALTGTPLENRAADAASILEFVTGQSAIFPDVPRLRVLLSKHQLRRRKADVLADLPPKIITTLPLPMTPQQRTAYEELEQVGSDALRVALEAGDLPQEGVMAQITKLQQICNFAPGAATFSAKLDDLRERLGDVIAGGEQALIFTQFTNETFGARRIARELAHWQPLLFTGDMDAQSRQRALDNFATPGSPPLLIVSLRAGGIGLNLQNASYVFHFDRWWNPAAETQAEDRAHRPGQTRPVHVYRYVMLGTLEERIDAILRSKRELFAQVVDGEETTHKSTLSREDWLQLAGVTSS
jgi:SNF2 family DNA or RNA helicase